LDAPPVVTDDTRELVRDAEDTDEVDEIIEQRASAFVARINPKVDVQLGETAPLVVDTSELHVFDPDDGRALAGA
jgi:multiple sugar transport system ATP-binding protein